MDRTKDVPITIQPMIVSNRKAYKSKPLQYTFDLPAPRVQLDYDKIASDLSYKNCIALVTAESKQDKEFVVLIDSSIIRKYEYINDSHFKPFGSTDYNTFVCIELSSESEFEVWINWCKTVKRLPWPKDIKEQTTIKVSIPKVEV